MAGSGLVRVMLTIRLITSDALAHNTFVPHVTGSIIAGTNKRYRVAGNACPGSATLGERHMLRMSLVSVRDSKFRLL